MSVTVLINITGTDDPYLAEPGLVDLPALPAPGDWINFERNLTDGPYGPIIGNVIIEVVHRQFSLERDSVQLDCKLIDSGHRQPHLREV